MPSAAPALALRLLAFVLVIAAAALTPPPAPQDASADASMPGPCAGSAGDGRVRLEDWRVDRVRAMFILIVGAGRVGSAVAKRALEAGHDVSVLDTDPLSHERLDKDLLTTWEDSGGRFTVGTALEVDALIAAGIEEADVFIASTRGDNTNLVIAQIAQRRFNVPRVIARVPIPDGPPGTPSGG